MSLASKVKIQLITGWPIEYENCEVFFEGPWLIVKKDHTHSYVYPIHLVLSVTIEAAKVKSFDSIERS